MFTTAAVRRSPRDDLARRAGDGLRQPFRRGLVGLIEIPDLKQGRGGRYRLSGWHVEPVAQERLSEFIDQLPREARDLYIDSCCGAAGRDVARDVGTARGDVAGVHDQGAVVLSGAAGGRRALRLKHQLAHLLCQGTQFPADSFKISPVLVRGRAGAADGAHLGLQFINIGDHLL